MTIKENRIVAIIPARGGSKAIPNKNIKDLAGKPMIAYTIEEALKVKEIDRVIVSTDSKEIASISEKYGAEVPFTRPKNISDDKTPVLPDVIKHAVDYLENEGHEFDIVVVLQPTSPLRKSKHIEMCVKKLIKTNCDWVATVSKTSSHPFRMRKLEGDKLIPLIEDKRIFAQRQDMPPVYIINGAVFITWKKTMKEKSPLEGKEWRGVIMNEMEAIDIDTPIDFLMAEKIKESVEVKK